MVQPIFFPFTHFKKKDYEIVSALFKSIIFFPVSGRSEFEESIADIGDAGVILPVFPEEKQLGMVLQKVDEFRRWGELNQDNRGNLKTFFQDKPCFTSDTDPGYLRARIKRTADRSDEPGEEETSLLKDLMFLRLAKLHDFEKEGLQSKFDLVLRDEHRLFSEIQGISSEFDRESVEDAGAYMTAERVSAWCNFFNANHLFNMYDSDLLFVTTSSAVMEYLLSVSKNKIKLLDIDGLKVHENKCENKNQWVETFNKYVENLVTKGQQALDAPAERDDNCALEIKIKLYLLKGDVISSFFQGLDQKVLICLLSV